MTKSIVFALLLPAWMIVALSSCESDAARNRQLQAEAHRKVAREEEDQASAQARHDVLLKMELDKQYELDRVEHRRTGDVYSHSCRKAVALDPLFPVSVDTKGCTSAQLTAELNAERKQQFEDAAKKAGSSDDDEN